MPFASKSSATAIPQPYHFHMFIRKIHKTVPAWLLIHNIMIPGLYGDAQLALMRMLRRGISSQPSPGTPRSWQTGLASRLTGFKLAFRVRPAVKCLMVYTSLGAMKRASKDVLVKGSASLSYTSGTRAEPIGRTAMSSIRSPLWILAQWRLPRCFRTAADSHGKTPVHTCRAPQGCSCRPWSVLATATPSHQSAGLFQSNPYPGWQPQAHAVMAPHASTASILPQGPWEQPAGNRHQIPSSIIRYATPGCKGLRAYPLDMDCLPQDRTDWRNAWQGRCPRTKWLQIHYECLRHSTSTLSCLDDTTKLN